MIKFVKGEVVSYSSLIDIPVTVNISHIIPNHPPSISETIRLGNYLVVESIRLVSHRGDCSIKFYGINNHIAVSSLVEARNIFHRVAIKISEDGDTFVISNHNVFLRALKAVNFAYGNPDPDNARSNGQSREFFGSIQAELNNTGSSPLHFGNSTILKETALDNRTCTFNLAAHALNSFETSTSVALDWSELLDARTSTEQNSIISFKIAQGIRRNNPTTITESYSADQVFARPTTANWIKYGFASQEDYDHEVEVIYYELLDDEGLDADDLTDEDSSHWMDDAEARLLHRLKVANKKPKEEKLNVKMLKFKDLLFINHNLCTKAAICLADIPEISNSTIVPILIRDGNNYIQGSIPFVNILKKVPTLEDVATRVKITGYKESSDIFGYRKTKEAVVGNIYSYMGIEKGFTCKKDNQVRDTIIVDLGKSNFRFVLSEVEFVFPTVNRVQLKKDKSIKIDSTCTIYRNKGLNVPIGRKVTVLEIKTTPQGASSKKLFKNSKNRQLDLATVSDIETGKTFKTYLKNLKFIQ